MKILKMILGWGISFAALVAYVVGIFIANFSPEKTADGTLYVPDPLGTVMTIVSGVLLANVLAVLGISLFKLNSSLAKFTFLKSSPFEAEEKLTFTEIVQLSAAIIYIVTLSISTFFWWRADFTSDPKALAGFIIQSGKTFFIVFISWAAFIIGVPKSKT